MEKITVIIGKAESGKTMKAKEIASSYKKENVTWISGRDWKHDRPFLYRSCNLNTELIIIDDCDDASHIESIYSSVVEGIKVETPSKEPFYIHPRIIVVCSSEVSIDDFIQSNAFKRRVTIIDCNMTQKETSKEVIDELCKILDATPKKYRETMTPQEKAEELVDKYYNILPFDKYVITKDEDLSWEYNDWEEAKKCALIAVDEIIIRTRSVDTMPYNCQKIDENTKEYWKEVKQEIELL